MNILDVVIFKMFIILIRSNKIIFYNYFIEREEMSWFGNIGKAFGAYEDLKGRNNQKVVNPNGCGKVVNTFAKNGKWMGAEGRSGACGTQKDHSRVYTCRGCY